MCLAIPAEVVEVIEGEIAVVDFGDAKKRVSLALVDGVEKGDFVLVHAGFAIEKVDAEEALKTRQLFEELERLNEAN
ncbi:MAG: HypC/HybG/HupF family hydrogenase formation chaperone [Actinomycetota bacterium]|nr:HypC/HybG/HupF family hydrogenase formation chaperone [Actinomycetota bacterium]